MFFPACQRRDDAVSGTIEVDEVHVAPRVGGRVEKIFAREGEPLRAGQIIMQLEASELKARRDYVAAQLAELEKGHVRRGDRGREARLGIAGGAA